MDLIGMHPGIIVEQIYGYIATETASVLLALLCSIDGCDSE